MCAADAEEYMHIAEYAWLMNQDTLHASVNWRERRRNVADLDLAAITAAPLLVSSKRTTISLEASPFLLDSACTTHISPERSDFLTLHPIVDRTVTGVGGVIHQRTGDWLNQALRCKRVISPTRERLVHSSIHCLAYIHRMYHRVPSMLSYFQRIVCHPQKSLWRSLRHWYTTTHSQTLSSRLYVSLN